MPIEQVRPNLYNPNRMSDTDFTLLCRSMLEDGFTQPFTALATPEDGYHRVVDGEHRWTAAIVCSHLEANGLDATVEQCRAARDRREQLLPEAAARGLDVPVVLVDMSYEQARISTLRMNRARGSEDIELAAELLRDLQRLGALDHAQDSLMLDDATITLLIENVPAPEVLAGEEFGEAWEPQRANNPQDSPHARTSLSDRGAETLRRQEQAIAEARTESERRQAERDHAVYRLSLIFSGDEAEIIRAVMGDRPAVVCLELCRARLAAQGVAR
jgi:ParB-like chromosome segregation protein Spo0J